MTDISALGEYLSPDQAEAVLNFQWYDIRAGQRFDFQRFGLYGGAETSVGATVAGIGSSLGLVHDFDSEAIGITLSSSIPFKVEGYSGTLEATQNTGLKLFIGKYPPQSAYSVPLSDGLYMWLDPSFSIEAGGYAEITGALDTFKDRVGFEQVRIGNGIVFDLETRERIGTFAKTSYTDDRNSNYSLNFKTKFLEADFNAAEYRRSRV